MTALSGLFLAAFLAATLLPAQSEAVLVGLILAGDFPVWLLVAVASAGNILGALLNWVIGRQAGRFRTRRWFPVSERALAIAERHYRRWGRWSLLFTWLPIVGDPLTVVAGVLREPLRTVVPLVAAGKIARYIVLAAGTTGLAGL